MPTGTTINDDLNAVRDFVEEARTSSDEDARERALRQADAAILQARRDIDSLLTTYLITRFGGNRADAKSWRTRKISISEFSFYLVNSSILALMMVATGYDHKLAYLSVPVACVLVVNCVLARAAIRKHYGLPASLTDPPKSTGNPYA